jgi:predicted kinase
MFEIADNLFPQKVGLIFDGIHPRVQNRVEVRALAEQHAVGSHIIFVKAEPEVISQRLRKRLEQPEETVAEGKFAITPEHFERLASYLEPPTEAEKDVVIVDTTESKIDEQLRWLDEQLADCYG